MQPAAMPKAPIDEYGHFFILKNKIWFSGDPRMSLPPFNFSSAQYFHQFVLRALIPARADPCHYFRAFRLGKHIHKY